MDGKRTNFAIVQIEVKVKVLHRQREGHGVALNENGKKGPGYRGA